SLVKLVPMALIRYYPPVNRKRKLEQPSSPNKKSHTELSNPAKPANSTIIITPTTQRILSTLTPLSYSKQLEAIRRDNEIILCQEQTQDMVPWKPLLTRQKIGLFVEEWFCANFTCPRINCHGSIALFTRCNMPVYDGRCLKCQTLWQIKTAFDDNYVSLQERRITISQPAVLVHQLAWNS